MSRRLTIFAHYSITSTVAPYVVFHLHELRRFSEKIIFVTNSSISDDSRHILSSTCDLILGRPNTGFDFAAWRDVIASEEMGDWDEILLTNSSIVGPLFDLSPMFNEMNSRHCDFWGLTQNMDTMCHIQSYFMCFRKPLTTSTIWGLFWGNVRDYTNKSHVILEYEVHLKSTFESSGYKGETYLPHFQQRYLNRIFVRRMNTRLPIYVIRDKNRTDPTIHSPYQLIQMGFPYLKASLLWGHNRRQPFPLTKIMSMEKVKYDWALVGLSDRNNKNADRCRNSGTHCL